MAFADFYKKGPLPERENPDEKQQQAAQPEANAAKAAPQSEIAGIPAPVEQPKNSTVDMSWWQSPHYAQAEQALQQQAQATMEQQERRALNERRAALLGDIARLGAQTWAKSGGAWMIPQTESQTATANNRLQQLRDKHAADMLAYSQRLQQARLADKQDQMRKEQTRQAIAKEQAATAAAAQQQAFDNVVTMQKMQNEREANAAKMAIDVQKMQNEREANAAKMAIDVQKMQNDAAYRQGMVAAAKRRADAYEQYVNGGGRAAKKELTLINPKDSAERYTMSESMYNGNLAQLYSMICEDLGVSTDGNGNIDSAGNKKLQWLLGLDKSVIGGSRTETMRNVVSALWQDSKQAKAFLKLLSEGSRQEQGQHINPAEGDNLGWRKNNKDNGTDW